MLGGTEECGNTATRYSDKGRAHRQGCYLEITTYLDRGVAATGAENWVVGPLASQWRCHRGGVGTLARARASQAKKTLRARDRSSAGSRGLAVTYPGPSKLTRKSSD